MSNLDKVTAVRTADDVPPEQEELSSAMSTKVPYPDGRSKLDDVSDPRARVELGVGLALRYAPTDVERAKAIIDEVTAALGELASPSVRETALVDVAQAFIDYRDGRFDDALGAAMRALTGLQSGDERWLARAYQCIGAISSARGALRQGLTEYATALDLSTTAGDHFLQAQILNQIGNAHQDLGDLGSALTSYEQSIAIAREHGIHRVVAIVLNNIGNVNSKLGELETARNYYQESLATLQSHPDDPSPSNEANALNNLAKNFEMSGDSERSLEYFLAALDKWTSANDLQGMAVALNNVGTAFDKLKRLDEAADYFQRSLDVAERIGQSQQMAMAMANLASIDAERGDLTAARAQIDRALELAEYGEATATLVAVLRVAHKIYASCGLFEEALAMYKRATKIVQSLNDAATRRRLLTIESNRKLDLAQKEAEIERLRNVELAEAHARLQRAHDELERAHAELKYAQAQLVHAEKMASLGQLTAGIAHEINNPINFIRTSTAPLRRDLDDVRAALDEALLLIPPHEQDIVRAHLRERDVDDLRAEIDALLRGIEDGATRTSEIVRGLRTFSRLDEDTIKKTDIHEGIDATLALLHAKLGSGISVVRSYGNIPRIDCLPGQINQVVMNLMTNAIDACDGAGTIEISTSSDSGEVRIAVSDSGSGIAPEHLDRIFEPFFTTKPVGAGQGLGLSIAHGIVERHGGRIDVASSTSGTLMTVVLPMSG